MSTLAIVVIVAVVLVVGVRIAWSSVKLSVAKTVPRYTRGEILNMTHDLADSTGSFGFEIVGESHYQAALKSITYGGDKRMYVTAHVVLEDDNPHDPKAVAVEVADLTIGYFPRDDAREYRKMLKKKKLDLPRATCPAVLVTGPEGTVGVWLSLPLENDFSFEDD